MGGLALNKSLTDYCANFTYSMWVDLVGWVKNLNQMEQTYLVCHHQVCDPLDSDLRELFVGHWALIVTWLLGQVSSLLCAYIKWSIGAVCGLFRPQTTNH